MIDEQQDGAQPLRNARHEAFCLAYAGEHRRNAAASYRAAGYSSKKNHNAAAIAQKLLTKSDIRARVAFLDRKAAELARLSARDAIERLAAIATVTIADFLDERGRVDPEKLKDPRLAQAVAEAIPVYDREGCFLGWRLRLKDDMRALELLGLVEQPKPEGAQQVLIVKL